MKPGSKSMFVVCKLCTDVNPCANCKRKEMLLREQTEATAEIFYGKSRSVLDQMIFENKVFGHISSK